MGFGLNLSNEYWWPRPHFRICLMIRIQTRSTTKATVVSDVFHPTDFTQLWRHLRAAGWKSKRPAGLANNWTDTSPNGYSFLGKLAVEVFVFQSGLLSEKEGADSVASGNAELEATNETLTASQIDTSANHELVVGAFQRLLSAAESSAEPEDVDDGEAIGDDALVGDADRLVVATNDVNVLGDGDVSRDYESIGSSVVESSLEDRGDEDVKPCEYPDEEVKSDEEVARMSDAFIMDQTTLREHEWGPLSSEFEAAWKRYPNLPTDVAMPSHEPHDIADSPSS
ncbi:unnamed protein product [Phytophthora fragariaefolia]|uniref:Unnamed protein product n=1 Tax=Phytophthora fragariaefolia TaxID=1490495 RepID=A0A9W7CZR5_9STRA|nr:unnamed protein product [Phytophthora fragariaefolia]